MEIEKQGNRISEALSFLRIKDSVDSIMQPSFQKIRCEPLPFTDSVWFKTYFEGSSK